MANTSRKQKHSYRLSYAYEVGSSIDPDMEDVGKWEHELQGMPSFCLTLSFLKPWWPEPLDTEEFPDVNLSPKNTEDEELQAYAEEYAALVDFEDIDGEEWGLSDLEDIDPQPPRSDNMAISSDAGAAGGDVDMS